MSTSNGADGIITAAVTKCVLLWADRPSDRPHSKLYPLMARAMIGPCLSATSRRPGQSGNWIAALW